MKRQLPPELPVAVISGWKIGKDPAGTEVMFFLREGFGHHTEILDAADMEAWLSEHHPEVFTTDGGNRTLDFSALAPEVLAPCLKHARAKKWERSPLKGIEYGHLVDADHPYMNYATVSADWPQPGFGVVQDGKATVLPVVATHEFGHGQRHGAKDSK